MLVLPVLQVLEPLLVAVGLPETPVLRALLVILETLVLELQAAVQVLRVMLVPMVIPVIQLVTEQALHLVVQLPLHGRGKTALLVMRALLARLVQELHPAVLLQLHGQVKMVLLVQQVLAGQTAQRVMQDLLVMPRRSGVL